MLKSIYYYEKQCLPSSIANSPYMDYPPSLFLEQNLDLPPSSIIFQETQPSYKLGASHYGVCVCVCICVCMCVKTNRVIIFQLYFDCTSSVQKGFYL